MHQHPLRIALCSVLLLVLAAAAGGGCAGRRHAQSAEVSPADAMGSIPPSATEPTQAGALAVLTAYADARKAMDFDRAYALLTLSAQDAFSPQEFASAYQDQQSYAYTAVAVEAARGGLVRGNVAGLILTGAKSASYARFPYTLRYEGGRWGVAQASGLAPRALQAFYSGRWEDSLKLTEQWLAIDPFAWSAYLERFYVYKDTNRPAEALAAWEQALALAPPEEQPDLYDTLAMLYVLNRQAGELLDTARKALDSAALLGKEHAGRYGTAWRAGVFIDMAFAYRYQGDEAAAAYYYQEARALDPKNMDVERFWRTVPAL